MNNLKRKLRQVLSKGEEGQSYAYGGGGLLLVLVVILIIVLIR